MFINLSRGGSPCSLCTGVLPFEQACFTDAVSEALPDGGLILPLSQTLKRVDS
jgi:hypothetical protein